MDSDPDGKDEVMHERIREILAEMGFDKKVVPSKNFKYNRTFAEAVRKILYNERKEIFSLDKIKNILGDSSKKKRKSKKEETDK